jgi:hypothetical protein
MGITIIIQIVLRLCTIFSMNKYSLLLAVLSLFGGEHVLAQTKPDKAEPEKNKQETVKAEEKPAPAVKVVPAAKSKHAKPEKVTSAKPRNARPNSNRPARNARPSGRPVRPGNGRQ